MFPLHIFVKILRWNQLRLNDCEERIPLFSSFQAPLLIFCLTFVPYCRDQAQRINFSGAPSVVDSSITVLLAFVIALFSYLIR